MAYIDQTNWPRREHFEVFNGLDWPHFGLCVNVDMTRFLKELKEREISVNTAIVYVLARTANEIPEFRQRIREKGVFEHKVVHPSTTIMGNNELFSFCKIDYDVDFTVFSQRARERVAAARENPHVEDDAGEKHDDLLFMTAIPWVSFTSFMHPLGLYPADSVPRFAWGKIFDQGGRMMMPLGVQAHHALMDGLHAARFYEKAQGYFTQPEGWSAGGG